MISDKLQRAHPEGSRNEHPILAGLVALVAVIAVVAGVVGVAAMIGSKALGFTDDGVIDTGRAVEETLFLPKPSETEAPGTPYITLPGGPETSSPTKKKNKPTPKPTPIRLISLSAAQTAVGPMEQIDLTGDYSAGEGAILRVQQFENGSWGDFPVTASVSGGRFSTFIQTGNTGLNRFRVIDTDTGEASNEIKVQVG